MNFAPNCASIPAGYPFARSVGEWLMSRYGNTQEGLARVLVLLPNRRACRSLREAFLDISGGKPLLLPRISPIGDLEEDALEGWGEAQESLPAALDATRAQFLLMRLVQRFGEQARHGMRIDEAAPLALQLQRFLAEAQKAGLSLDTLQSLVPEALAAHWQETLDFLKILTRHWPEILAQEGAIDAAEHRRLRLLATASAWQNTPPSFPIIAAGSTGSQHATAELLATIAKLPQGMVVLPALDAALSDQEWQQLGCTHPQFGMKQLLARIGIAPSQVRPLAAMQTQHPASALWRQALATPAGTAQWHHAPAPAPKTLNNLRLMTADSLLDEARNIAICLRETLEIPSKTAALVTHDRTLARLVVSQMQRFGIAIDDSAGIALSDTPPAMLLRHCVQLALSGCAPVALLSLLQHPLATAGTEPEACRHFARLLDQHYLRGLRPARGLAALIENSAGSHPELQQFLKTMAEYYAPFAELFERHQVDFGQLLAAHVRFSEFMAGGEALLWQGEAGNQLAARLAELRLHAPIVGDIDPSSYASLLLSLLSTATYRPAYGLHPRLHILSPLEARMQHFDRVILGSMNEGSWPPPAAADPWMSRPMREAFGLPPREQEVGQSAHDFYVLCHAPEVILSRARKVGGTPTIASRWITRLETLLASKLPAALAQCDISQRMDAARSQLERPHAMTPLAPPAPCPPLSARPRALRATAIDAWLRDPYVIYARYILNLKKLDALDEDPDAADFGELVHKALELFTARYPQALPEDAQQAMWQCGREAFAPLMDRPAVQCLWWPRFASMARWVLAQEAERRGQILQVLGERKGEWRLLVDGREFRISTRIDRLELRRDGELWPGDYKTGSLPTPKEREQGLANQLALEALVVSKGELTPPLDQPASVAGMEYWKLAADENQCDIVALTPELDACEARLVALIRRFDDARQPYAAQTNPALRLRYNDYAQLIRAQEWEEV